jgi:putative effector of murein hydrolase
MSEPLNLSLTMILLTLAIWLASAKVFALTQRHPLANPVVVSIIVLLLVLSPYPVIDYGLHNSAVMESR